MTNEELLIAYIQEVVTEMAEQIAKFDLTRQEQVDALLLKMASLLDKFDLTVTELMPLTIIEKYFGSVDEATALMAASGLNVAPVAAITTTTAATAGVAVGAAAFTIAEPFKKKIHVDAVNELIADSLLDFRAAIRTAKTSGHSCILETLEAVKGDLVKGMAQGQARKKIQATVQATFLEKGFDAFESSDGRMIPLDAYAMTVVRTKTRDASVQGSTNRYVDSGQDLVQIIENSDTCPICGRFRDMVVSLTGKTEGYPAVGQNGIKLPPYHPNCRGSVRPYVARFKTEDEMAATKKRNAKYAEGKDIRTKQQKEDYKTEQKARARANNEKKQFMRWQQRLGAEAPKTLGAFRRMKRENSVKFQELQSMYRSSSSEGV